MENSSLTLSIVVLCSHPASTIKTVLSLLSLLPETQVEVILCVRSSDSLLKQYEAVYEQIPIEAKTLLMFESNLDSAITNEAVFLSQCEFVMAVHDGMTFEESEEGVLETKMRTVSETMLDNIFVLFPSSEYRSPIVPKRVIEILGYYAFSAFENPKYQDKWLGSIFYDLCRMFQATLVTTTDTCQKTDKDENRIDELNFNNMRKLRKRHLTALVANADPGE